MTVGLADQFRLSREDSVSGEAAVHVCVSWKHYALAIRARRDPHLAAVDASYVEPGLHRPLCKDQLDPSLLSLPDGLTRITIGWECQSHSVGFIRADINVRALYPCLAVQYPPSRAVRGTIVAGVPARRIRLDVQVAVLHCY